MSGRVAFGVIRNGNGAASKLRIIFEEIHRKEISLALFFALDIKWNLPEREIAPSSPHPKKADLPASRTPVSESASAFGHRVQGATQFLLSTVRMVFVRSL
jgi:hypothetical protein